MDKRIIIADEDFEFMHVYRSIAGMFADGPTLPKKKPVKVITKYDHERILKNEIKQADKAAKRLARRQS